jgi:hypothetical protein
MKRSKKETQKTPPVPSFVIHKWYALFKSEDNEQKVFFDDSKVGPIEIKCPFCEFILKDVLKNYEYLGIVPEMNFKIRCSHFKGYYIYPELEILKEVAHED